MVEACCITADLLARSTELQEDMLNEWQQWRREIKEKEREKEMRRQAKREKYKSDEEMDKIAIQVLKDKVRLVSSGRFMAQPTRLAQALKDRIDLVIVAAPDRPCPGTSATRRARSSDPQVIAARRQENNVKASRLFHERRRAARIQGMRNLIAYLRLDLDRPVTMERLCEALPQPVQAAETRSPAQVKKTNGMNDKNEQNRRALASKKGPPPMRAKVHPRK